MRYVAYGGLGVIPLEKTELGDNKPEIGVRNISGFTTLKQDYCKKTSVRSY